MKLRREAVLGLGRLGMLAAIAWIARGVALAPSAGGVLPITLREVQAVLPEAAALQPATGPTETRTVLDANGAPLGRALRTSPLGDGALGYAGPSDVLLVLDPAGRCLGARLRSSADTPGHVADVRADARFWSRFEGRDADALRALELDGVAGATRTSAAVSGAVRLRFALDPSAPAPFRPATRDLVIGAIALAMIVTPLLRGRPRLALRKVLRLVGLLYLGFATGDLLSVSLMGSWTQQAAGWRAAPGLALLFAAALCVPAFGGGPVYCRDVCPAGTLQRAIARVTPARLRVRLPASLEAALRPLPAALLVVALIALLLGLPLDLATLEVFDAFGRGWLAQAAFGLAVVSLVASPFVPMAYCRFGCPTGALLEQTRPRGRAGLRVGDGVAIGCFALAWWLAANPDLPWVWLAARGMP